MAAKRRRAQQAGARMSRRVVSATVVLATFCIAAPAYAFVGDKGGGAGRGWRTIGRDAADTRDQPFEHIVGPANVSRLAPTWIATTAGDVSATPVVAHHAVYLPDWGGMLWKLDAQTGAVIWSHPISDYTGIPNDISRSSPSLAGDTLVIGDLLAPDMMGIDAQTGALRWLTQVNPHPPWDHHRLADPGRRHHLRRRLLPRERAAPAAHVPR